MKGEEFVEGREVVHHPVTVVKALGLLVLEKVVSFLELGRSHVELFDEKSGFKAIDVEQAVFVMVLAFEALHDGFTVARSTIF